MSHKQESSAPEPAPKAKSIEEIAHAEQHASTAIEAERQKGMKEISDAKEKAAKIVSDAVERARSEREKSLERLAKQMEEKRKHTVEDAHSKSPSIRKKTLSMNAKDGIVRELVKAVTEL